ncbi:PREDICTED: probable serine-O-acetyltransferase cys2 [Acropora digitifera]|uniref:probable serine-O-acetyltransferase cys2 n=1 Tax=Acropora digitifera TaxID=70779 RepID=UPI00077AA08A|nr:PREDICTED: probable serine-O-acetyltransferase cys2 [Acropora digitifera]
MLSRTLLANSSWYRCLCTKATLRRSIPFCASYSHRRDMHEETKIKIPDFSQEFKGMDPSFPCLTEQAPRSSIFGVDPVYSKVNSGYKTFLYDQQFEFKYNGGVIPQLQVAYETWGHLNDAKDNVVLLCSGLSASSHAKSHPENPTPGWWESFIGPGCALDTDKFFIICCNNLGGCYGSSGPSSINPVTHKPYATTFPIVSVDDMVYSFFLLLDSLGIEKVHAVVGASLGGMVSLDAAALFPDRVGRVVTISACAQSHPASIALRYVQRRVLMSDPNWNNGFYYDGRYPRLGMKHAREVATITYRSGTEWQQRFGRKRIDDPQTISPNLCPEFEIESYLDYQGDSFCVKYDPNSLLYISKAMDLFDLGEGFSSLVEGMARIQCPTLVLGVQSDVLFPVTQQREIEALLKEAQNHNVTYYELPSMYGHDTFLLDVVAVGAAVKVSCVVKFQDRCVL